MEFYQIINYLPPYALHAVLLATVVLSAVLVFVFSFRNIGEPPFSEKKSANKKKKQPKEKVRMCNTFYPEKFRNLHLLVLKSQSGTL